MKHKDELFEKLLKDPETGEKLELLDELHETYLTGKLKSFKDKELQHDFVGIIDLLLLTNKGFVLVDYKNLHSSQWFDNEVQKMCSVAASMASMYFNKQFICQYFF